MLISLLSNLSKAAKSIILSKHRDAISEGNFLPDAQFGFREGFLAYFQPLRLTATLHGRNLHRLRICFRLYLA